MNKFDNIIIPGATGTGKPALVRRYSESYSFCTYLLLDEVLPLEFKAKLTEVKGWVNQDQSANYCFGLNFISSL